MVDTKEKNRRRKFIFVSFLLCLLPRLLFLLKVYPLSVTGDESFMFMPAASWAGLDWSGNAGNYRYYGYGFVALLTPLFKWIDDPIVLYRIIVGIMILLQALVGPIAYHIAEKYFSAKNSLTTLLLSVSSSYLVFIRGVYAYNEFIYDFVIWLIFWCFLELLQQQNDKRKKAWYTLLIMLLLTYEMTIHSRGITLWLALGVTILFFAWIYKKCIVSIPVMAVVGAIGYFLSQKGIDYIVQMFTSVATSGEISNTEVSFSISSILGSAKSGMGWVYIVLGQLNSMVLVTGGVALIAFVIGVKVLWNALLRKKETLKEEGFHQNYILVFTFGLVCCGITILGQSFSWLEGVAGSIEMNQTTDAMRAVTYLRYYGIYFVPVLLACLVWVTNHKEKFKKYIKPICLIMIGLQMFWVVFIIPYITGYNGTCWEFAPFSLVKGWEETIRIRSYLPVVLFAIVFISIFLALLIKEKSLLGIILFCGVLVYTYSYNGLYHEGQRGEINYSYVNRSYELYKMLEKKAVVPENLYVEDLYFPETGQSLVSEAQFVFKDKVILPQLPDKKVKEGIFITCDPREKKELFKQGYMFSQIDENEYWYVKGEKIQKILEKAGVTLTSYMKQESYVGLNQFLSDVKITGNGYAYMDSKGEEEGYFIYGYEMPYSRGKIEFSMDLQLFSYYEEKIGTFELWKDGKMIVRKDIDSTMADENGNLDFAYVWEGKAKKNIEPRIYLNPGSSVRLKEISFKR